MFFLLFLLFIITFMQGIYNNIIYLEQTIFLGYVLLQLFSSYSSVVVLVTTTVSLSLFFFVLLLLSFICLGGFQ